ncbi:MAG TPA: hypothetical protein VGH89_43000 [Pseudonocardia sp.]
MKPYAELPGKRGWQIAVDVLALCWLIGFWLIASHASDLVLQLRTPTSAIIQTGSSIAQMFGEGAQLAGQIPFIGGALAAAMEQGQQAGQALTNIGQQQADSVTQLASGTWLIVLFVGLLPLVVLWLPSRLRYARAAADAVALRAQPGGLDLLALRALTELPAAELLRVTETPAAAWRQADSDVLNRLASLTLHNLGLHPSVADTSVPG